MGQYSCLFFPHLANSTAPDKTIVMRVVPMIDNTALDNTATDTADGNDSCETVV